MLCAVGIALLLGVMRSIASTKCALVLATNVRAVVLGVLCNSASAKHALVLVPNVSAGLLWITWRR